MIERRLLSFLFRLCESKSAVHFSMPISKRHPCPTDLPSF